MASTHENLAAWNALVITVSDRCASSEQPDRSGPAVADALAVAGCTQIASRVVSDDREPLEALLREASSQFALILTTGGTGVAPRDTTPEATLAVADRLVPGLAEQMRAAGLAETPFAALGRGVAAIAGRCLIVNLPGSPRGATSSFQAIAALLPHALALLAGETPHDPPDQSTA